MPKSIEKIMALCKRRGFIYQASDLYGGLNGFWDYGPLRAQLQKNLRDRWGDDVVMGPCNGALGPGGQPVEVVGLGTCIIQHPPVWVRSDNTETSNDPMVDCGETKARYRFDQVPVSAPAGDPGGNAPRFAFVAGTPSETRQRKKAEKAFGAVAVVPLTQLPAETWSR